jgi:hypothetical protein
MFSFLVSFVVSALLTLLVIKHSKLHGPALDNNFSGVQKSIACRGADRRAADFPGGGHQRRDFGMARTRPSVIGCWRCWSVRRSPSSAESSKTIRAKCGPRGAWY